VYQGRTGDLNYDFFDLERVEIIRGPQGVLLGKNVVGGALSVITAKPTFEDSGALQLSYGNYSSVLAGGHVNGGLSDSVAGRFSFQYRAHDGFATDILHNREVEDLDSVQGRAQLLFKPDGSAWSGRFALDYNKDSNNGINVVAVDGGTTNCESTYLRTNCTRPWSNLRRFLGITDPRQNVAQSIQYAGEPRIQQFMERDSIGLTLDIEFQGNGFTFNSLTGYRDGSGEQVYDQTGAGPEALNWDLTRWAAYRNFVSSTIPGGQRLQRALPVRAAGRREDDDPAAQPGVPADLQRQGQPHRLDRRRLLQEGQHRQDRSLHRRELPRGVVPGGNNPLSTLSGENRWVNEGENENYAIFGQVGSSSPTALKLSVGVRYTSDDKEGNVRAWSSRRATASARPTRAPTSRSRRCRAPAAPWSAAPAARCTCVAPNRWIFQAKATGFATRLTARSGASRRRRPPSNGPSLRVAVHVRDGGSGLQGRRLRRHAGEHRAGDHAVRPGDRRRTTRSASRPTCSIAASA
jgi:iron complex outermembrane recepter protein